MYIIHVLLLFFRDHAEMYTVFGRVSCLIPYMVDSMHENANRVTVPLAVQLPVAFGFTFLTINNKSIT